MFPRLVEVFVLSDDDTKEINDNEAGFSIPSLSSSEETGAYFSTVSCLKGS